ncbi:hypothetical protein K525DRAFT_213996 [Schizophyllum commune Loenen D]|nr:hypothetical protein K525DRAFT_213996 [Schizophyllum commune Loenen D]
MSNPDPEAALYQAAPPIENMGTPVDLGPILSQEDQTPAPKDRKGKAKAKEVAVAGSTSGSVAKKTYHLFGHPVSKEARALYDTWQNLFRTWAREGAMDALLTGLEIDYRRLALRANAIEQALYAGDYPSWQTGYAGMKILRQCTHVDPILSKVDEFLCRLLNEHAPPDCVSAAFQASHSLRATLQATCTHYTTLHCKFLEWGRDDELPRKHIAIIKAASFTSIRVPKGPIPPDTSTTSAPPAELFFELRRKEIFRLAPDEWLNDEIINFFVELFTYNPQSRNDGVVALLSHFARAEAAARFGGLKLINASNVKNLKLLLIPLHVHNNHWSLLVMDFVKRHGVMYDSLPPKGEESAAALKRMRDCMQAVWKLKKIPVPNRWWEEWKWFADPPGVPRQNNVIDCGVYCISFMVHLHKWGKINHERIPAPSRIPLAARRAHLEGVAALAGTSGRPKAKKAAPKRKRTRAPTPSVLIDEDTEQDDTGTDDAGADDLANALNAVGAANIAVSAAVGAVPIFHPRLHNSQDDDGDVTMSSELQVEARWSRTRGCFGSLGDDGDDSEDSDEERVIDDEGVNTEGPTAHSPSGAYSITLKPPSELGAMLAEAEAEAQTHTPDELASGELNFMETPPQSPSPSRAAVQQFEDDWEDEKEPSEDSPKDESSKKRTKGPWRKSHVSVLRHLGRRLTGAVRYYAKLYNHSVNSVWRQMMLEVPYGRKANLANLHRQRYRIVHPKHPEEDYIGKVNGILDQAKDKLRCRILADLVRLGEDIVNVPAGVRINACQRQLQKAVLTANTSIVLKTYLELSTILQCALRANLLPYVVI